jgi:hypothetical protein
VAEDELRSEVRSQTVAEPKIGLTKHLQLRVDACIFALARRSLCMGGTS